MALKFYWRSNLSHISHFNKVFYLETHNDWISTYLKFLISDNNLMQQKRGDMRRFPEIQWLNALTHVARNVGRKRTQVPYLNENEHQEVELNQTARRVLWLLLSLLWVEGGRPIIITVVSKPYIPIWKAVWLWLLSQEVFNDKINSIRNKDLCNRELLVNQKHWKFICLKPVMWCWKPKMNLKPCLLVQLMSLFKHLFVFCFVFVSFISIFHIKYELHEKNKIKILDKCINSWKNRRIQIYSCALFYIHYPIVYYT